jgi:UDP-2,4-diacetamido-2,4,6-trideoxy-beta-L-altropyranose hydrolase
MDRQTLLVRADANQAMGTGHVMRCLALAQAWQDTGGQAIFAMAESSPSLRKRLRGESITITQVCAPSGTDKDARATIALASQHAAGWVAVDGYQFGAEYQRALKDNGFKVLFLDDHGHADHYYADLVLNQNISAEEKLYENRDPGTHCLLGTKYCLLRREFTSWRHWKREIGPVGHRVLITMGGSDPEEFTRRAIAALDAIEDERLEAIVVVGGSNVRSSQLKTCCAASNKITLRRDVTNMAELMTWADVAISAAGTTSWELCLLGLPSILIDLAENQTRLAQELDRRGCAIHLGNAECVSSDVLARQLSRLLPAQELRRSMSSLSGQLVDGEGASRVVSALRGAVLRLRSACENDCHLLWEWANDEQVRAASFSASPIPWTTHLAWFAEKLGQDGSHILIAEIEGGTPVGQVRFDRRPDRDYEIAVSLCGERRGQGLAVPLIRQALESFSASSTDARIHAFVKPENSASLKAFAGSGFERIGLDSIQGHAAVHLVWQQKYKF